MRQMREMCLGLVFDNGWQEPLNGFAPISQRRHVWYFARTSLNIKVKVKGQGHQEQKSDVHSEHPRSIDGMERPRCR